MRNKHQKGFTLIELLVVIVILGILSTISVGTFRSYFAKARDAERVSAVQNVAMMIKADSGAAGDCSLYNYALATDAGCTADSISDTRLADLLAANDYSMPEPKNSRNYYYGFKNNTPEDNDFFVAVVAEEESPQNAVKVADLGYIFVDGTGNGVAAIDGTTNPDKCTISGTVISCTGSEWKILSYDDTLSWN